MMQFRAVALAAAMAGAAAAPPAHAQPLRLAKSLCTSMTAQVLTSQLIPPLASTATGAPTAALAARLDEQRDAYFARLDALKPFSGLYATGQADHALADANDRGARYSFGLEWELYDQGRGESRKQLQRLRIENKAQYMQVLRDMEQRQLQENLLAVDQMRNKLLATMYEREAAAIRPLLERRRQELAAGRITRADLAEIEYRAERAALRARHHASSADIVVYPQALELANRIEALVLRPDGELAGLAASRSADQQVQALLAERSQLLPAPDDRLSVRLYVERAKEFERGPYNAAGVRVRIPLEKDNGMREVADASRELFTTQQEALKVSLHQKIALLSDRLRLKQNDMRLLQAENRLVRSKAELACYRLDYPVASIAGDPDRDVEELTLRLHELQREILASRLDILEVLAQLNSLVKPREPAELYTLAPAPP